MSSLQSSSGCASSSPLSGSVAGCSFAGIPQVAPICTWGNPFASILSTNLKELPDISDLQSSSGCVPSAPSGGSVAGCSAAETTRNNNWLTILTAAAMVGAAGGGGHPQGPPLPPAFMQVQGGAAMVTAMAAFMPAGRLPRFKNVMSDIRRFALAMYNA